MGISLDGQSEQPTTQPIPMDPIAEEKPPSGEEAAFRAYKAKFGIGALDQTYDQIYQDITSGEEDRVRRQAASKIDFIKAMQRNKAIAEFARAKGGPLTPEDMSLLDFTLSAYKPTDPSSVFEQYYAKAYMNYVAKTGAVTLQSDWYNAQRALPQQYIQKEIDDAGSFMAYREYALKWQDKAQQALDEQSYIGWSADMLKTFVPGYTEVKNRGNIPGSTQMMGLGADLEEQGKAAFHLPFEQYKSTLDTVMPKLISDNPSVALQWIKGIIGQSTSEQILNSVFTGIDVASIFGVAKGTLKFAQMAKAATDVRALVKATIKSTEKVKSADDVKPVAAEIAGDAAESAVQKSATNLMRELHGTNNPAKETIESLPSYLQRDFTNIEATPGRFGREIVNRLKESYAAFSVDVMDTIANIMRVERLPAVFATEKAVRLVLANIKDRYPKLKNTIMDISIPYKDPIANVYSVDVKIGKNSGEFFLSRDQAKNAAEVYGLKINPAEDILRQGNGWYIRVTKPLDETEDVIRDALLSTTHTTTPDSWLNTFLGWVRTPEETLSLDARKNRKIATYAPAALLEVYKDNSKEIRKLARWTLPGTKRNERWHDWERVVKAAEDLPDPTDGRKGYFFKSPGELEDFYQKTIGRLPDEQEIAAYFAFKRNYDLDLLLRNMAVYRNKHRVGVESHQFYAIDKMTGKRVLSPQFDGAIRRDLPGGDESNLILYVGKHMGEEQLLNPGHKPYTTMAKQLKEDIKSGKLSVIELWDPEMTPLYGWGAKVGDKRVRYVITPNVKTEGLDMLNQVPRRGGGHIEYDYDFYIKQANIRTDRYGGLTKHWYEGDNTIMPINNRIMGKDVAERLDQVRQLLRDGKLDEAKAFTEARLPIEWKELKSWFESSHDPSGKKLPPRLNLTTPIQVVPKNSMIIDVDKGLEKRFRANQFVDGSRQGSLARINQVEFTGQRDAYEVFTFKDVGSRHNPLYQIEPAKVVDPITTMNRAINRIVNSTFMDDYKFFSVEHWLREAEDLLDATVSEIRYSPFWYFNNVKWKSGALKEYPDRIRQLEIAHYQIKQLIGTPSTTDTLLHSATQRLADSVYAKFGNPDTYDIFTRSALLAPSWALSKVKDPFTFIRSVTFHAKLGLFTIPQLLVQLQTYATILGVAGLRYTGAGVYGTMLHGWAKLNKNPEILEALDNYATKLQMPGGVGWKPGQWKEAHELLNRSGFGHVGGEYAGLDAHMSPKIIQSMGRDFLDAGTIFFRTGERWTREGAFFTAYREYRDKLGHIGRLTDADKRAILERADLLYVNMSRASSSILHQGILSLPTQFLSYQLRAFELFTGKRITWPERGRLLTTYATLYGAPTAIGVTGLPLGDFIRRTAIENGYVVGDNWITSVINEGLPAMLLALTTGGGDYQKGNWYNIGDRFGTQGFETLREAFRGDRTMWDIFGGAAFSTLAGAWTASDGFRTAMLSAIRGDNQAFPLKLEDFVAPFKEISSVNNSWRTIAALNTGKWFSKKENMLDKDISKSNAIFMYLTGLQPARAADLNLMQWTRENEKDLQKYALNNFITNFRRGLNEVDNPSQRQDWMKRAFTWLEISGYPREKIPYAIALASRDHESMIERMDWSFYIKDVPTPERPRRQETYKAIQRIEQGKR